MTWIIIAATTLLPLLPLVLSPARAMGRGGSWKYVGAALIVGTMMLIFFTIQGLSGATDAIGGADATGASDADMQALNNLFK